MRDINLNGQKYLVTGGAGFIGSNLCESLLKNGACVINIDCLNDFYNVNIKKNNLKAIEHFCVENAINTDHYKFFKGDIRDPAFLEKVFSFDHIDAVIHLAAYAGVRPSIENPCLYMDVNVNGTVNLLEYSKKKNIRKFLFASSSSVYGNNPIVPFSESHSVDSPISPYAASKKSGELICHTYRSLYDMSIACLRFFTVYGPRQRPDLAIYKFTKMILEEKEIPFFGDGSSERDYTYITDILDGILKALRWVGAEEKRYDIFNLGESNTISLSRMVRILEDTLGKKAILKMLPFQPGDVQRTFADISKSRNVLGYDPKVKFEDGVKQFYDWYKDNAI